MNNLIQLSPQLANENKTTANEEGEVLFYRPSAWYWRKQIRECRNLKHLRKVAMDLIAELEDHKAEFRNLGLIPPKNRVSVLEAKDKGFID